jgi:hypothetical protein
MADANQLRDANPWHPIDDKVDLKHLGKLGEELSELAAAASKCGAAVSRCIIQGVDEAEPTSGKINRVWLEDEIADVRAGSELCIERFGLDEARIAARAEKKKAHLRQWHNLA